MTKFHHFLLRGLGILVAVLVFIPTAALCLYNNSEYGSYGDYGVEYGDWKTVPNDNDTPYYSGGKSGSTGSSGSSGSATVSVNATTKVNFKDVDGIGYGAVFYASSGVLESRALVDWTKRLVYVKSGSKPDYTKKVGEVKSINWTTTGYEGSWGYIDKTALDNYFKVAEPAPAPAPTPAPTPTLAPATVSVPAPVPVAPVPTPVVEPVLVATQPVANVVAKQPVVSPKPISAVAVAPAPAVIAPEVASLNTSIPAGAKLVFVENVDGVYTVFAKETGTAVPLAFYDVNTKNIYYGNSDELYGKMLTENIGYIEPDKFAVSASASTTVTVVTSAQTNQPLTTPAPTSPKRIAEKVRSAVSVFARLFKSLFSIFR